MRRDFATSPWCYQRSRPEFQRQLFETIRLIDTAAVHAAAAVRFTILIRL